MEQTKETVEPTEENLIEQAQKIAERMENANKEAKTLMERHERNRAVDALSGKREASIPTPEVSKEEIKKQGALDFFKGSEIEKALKTYG